MCPRNAHEYSKFFEEKETYFAFNIHDNMEQVLQLTNKKTILLLVSNHSFNCCGFQCNRYQICWLNNVSPATTMG
jgi:hypothetical protein